MCNFPVRHRSTRWKTKKQYRAIYKISHLWIEKPRLGFSSSRRFLSASVLSVPLLQKSRTLSSQPPWGTWFLLFLQSHCFTLTKFSGSDLVYGYFPSFVCSQNEGFHDKFQIFKAFEFGFIFLQRNCYVIFVFLFIKIILLVA